MLCIGGSAYRACLVRHVLAAPRPSVDPDTGRADDDDALLHLRERGDVLLEPVDDDHAGHPAFADLIAGLSVNVRVIPVESRLLVLRDVNDVVQALSGRCQPVENVVGVPSRRNGQAVKMEIDVIVHLAAGRQIVLNVDHEGLAGFQFDRRDDSLHTVISEGRQPGRRVDVGDQRDARDTVNGFDDGRLGELVHAVVRRNVRG